MRQPGIIRFAIPLGAALACLPAGFASADTPAASCSSLINQVDPAGAATTPCTVDTKSIVIGAGYQNVTFSGSPASGVVSYPDASIRYGFAKNFEVGIDLPDHERARFGSSTFDGSADAVVRVKYLALSTQRFAVGVQAGASLPTGDQTFTAGKSQYLVGAAGDYLVAPMLRLRGSLAYQSGFDNASSILGSQHFSSFAPALAVLGGTGKTQVFVEGSGMTTAGAGLGPNYRIGAGVNQSLGNSTIVSVGADDGVTSVQGTRSHGVTFALSQQI